MGVVSPRESRPPEDQAEAVFWETPVESDAAAQIGNLQRDRSPIRARQEEGGCSGGVTDRDKRREADGGGPGRTDGAQLHLYRLRLVARRSGHGLLVLYSVPLCAFPPICLSLPRLGCYLHCTVRHVITAQQQQKVRHVIFRAPSGFSVLSRKCRARADWPRNRGGPRE